VSGAGFSLTSAETDGLTNTLEADGTACGSATITVTDDCGESCTGYVRCTTGRWANRTLVMYNRVGNPMSGQQFNTVGKYRYYVFWYGAPPSTMCWQHCRDGCWTCPGDLLHFVTNNPYGVIGTSVFWECSWYTKHKWWWFRLGHQGSGSSSRVGYNCGVDFKNNFGINRQEWIC